VQKWWPDPISGDCTHAGCGFEATNGAGAADAPPAIDVPPGAWLTGFTYRKQVLVTPGGSGSLTDFPVGILLANDTDLEAHAAASGIVVTEGDGTTLLDSEVVAFGPNGALELWARIPSLPLAGTTVLYLYYGGAAGPSDGSVWPTSVFKAVWHLGDTGVGGADSTAHANHLDQPASGLVPAPAAGAVSRGRARMFDGNDDRLEISDPADGSLDVDDRSFSLSMWVHATGPIGPFDTPFYKGGTTASLRGYCLFLGNGPWAGKLHDGASFIEQTFAAVGLTNQWVHVAMTIDRAGSMARAFLNGQPVQSFDFQGLGSLASTQPVMVGAGSNGARFRGAIDEIRLYEGALPAAWIATEYANFATPSFIALGAQQQL
jgi:hypothetical protein